MNSMKRQKYMTLKDELPRSEVVAERSNTMSKEQWLSRSGERSYTTFKARRGGR